MQEAQSQTADVDDAVVAEAVVKTKGRIRISLLGTFNDVIAYINRQEEIPRNMQVLDVRAKIIVAGLERIAHRAIEIKDTTILSELLLLGVIQPHEEKKGDSV